MKKTFTLVTLLFVAILSSSAQKKIVFNTNYLPNTNYTVSTIMDMKMEMDFTGDTAQIKTMQNSGMKTPMLMLMNMDMQLGIKAGQKDARNEYPLIMTYEKMGIKGTVNGQQIPTPPTPLDGAKIFAKYNAAGTLEIDSIPGKVLDDATKQGIMTSVTELQRQFKFPAEGMVVGETFVQDIPMNMPVAGKNMEMLIKTTYKLLKVANNMAYFDIVYSIKMDIPVNNTTMKMTGGGDGKLEYSLQNKFINTCTSNLKFDYNMDVTKVTMLGKADMKSLYTVKVN